MTPRRLFSNVALTAVAALALPPALAAVPAAAQSPGTAAAQSPSPAPSGSPYVILGSLGYRVVSVTERSKVGSTTPVDAHGTFVLVKLQAKNETSVVQRARLGDSFVTSGDGSRFPVAASALVAMQQSAHLSTQEIVGEIQPGFSQIVPLAFDVPKGTTDLALHLLADYPDVGRQQVIPLRVDAR